MYPHVVSLIGNLAHLGYGENSMSNSDNAVTNDDAAVEVVRERIVLRTFTGSGRLVVNGKAYAKSYTIELVVMRAEGEIDGLPFFDVKGLIKATVAGTEWPFAYVSHVEPNIVKLVDEKGRQVVKGGSNSSRSQYTLA